MQENQPLETPEDFMADYQRRKAAGLLTEEHTLVVINRMRAQSGDRPLTMAEHLQIKEDSKNGIHVWTQRKPKPFFQRLKIALKLSRIEFQYAMRK